MNNLKVDWTTLKGHKNSRKIPLQFVEHTQYYYIVLFDGSLAIECLVAKDGGADCVDFETNFKAASNVSYSDDDGAIHVRVKSAKKGWHLNVSAMEIQTSVLNSLYFENYLGQPLNYGTVKFYDINNVELTVQATLDTDCVRSELDLTLPYDFEIIGGIIRWKGTMADHTCLSVVISPDIPYVHGGSRALAENIDLSYLIDDKKIELDGRAAKFLQYNNPIPGTNTLRMIIHHVAGQKNKIQIAPIIYRL